MRFLADRDHCSVSLYRYVDSLIIHAGEHQRMFWNILNVWYFVYCIFWFEQLCSNSRPKEVARPLQWMTTSTLEPTDITRHWVMFLPLSSIPAGFWILLPSFLSSSREMHDYDIRCHMNIYRECCPKDFRILPVGCCSNNCTGSFRLFFSWTNSSLAFLFWWQQGIDPSRTPNYACCDLPDPLNLLPSPTKQEIWPHRTSLLSLWRFCFHPLT